MFVLRWIVGMPMAALVTAGLFFMMAQLIKDRGEIPPEPKPSFQLKITPQTRETDPYEVKPPRDLPTEPPPPTDYDFPPLDPAGGPAPKPGPIEIERTPPGDGSRFGGAIIKIPPPYPENCRSRGVEGSVTVEFDVTPEGNVKNPRIVSSSHSCFNRTVIKSVSGWKYPPAANGGMRYGVMERFNFQLEE